MNINNKKLEICFAIHIDYNYTDILSGNDYEEIYKHLFANLYATPNIPFSLVLNGCFFDWAQQEKSPFLDVISEMVARKQIEILGNAYYEPFISTIPSSDLTSQIEYMTDAIRKHFKKHKRPRGLYLPYFAWNPSSIHILKKSGIEYCLLDTRYFDKAGLESLSPVCMEDSGKTIFGVPATCEFENMDASPRAFYDILRTYTSKNTENTVVFFLSPETATQLLEKTEENMSWMEEFFELSNSEESFVSVHNSSNFLKPQTIYQKGFLDSNGVFANQTINSSVKQLLVRKKHIYGMYAKMNYVHTIVKQIRGDKSRRKTAFLDLWHAEQGVLFNLDSKYEKYNRKLRQICYRNLLLAENQSRIPGDFVNSLSTLDFDLDGLTEYISQTNNINMYVHSLGAKVFELDVFNDYRNYADIASDDTGLFIDHLITADKLEAIKEGDFSSATSQAVFSNNLYQNLKINKFDLIMKTDSSFRTYNQALSLKKHYSFTPKGCSVQYIVKNASDFNLSAYFMVEIDIALAFENKNEANFVVFSNEKKLEASFDNNQFEALSWAQFSEPRGKSLFTIESNEPTNLIILPIYEQSPDAENPIVGVRSLFYWKIDIEPKRDSEKMLFFNIEPQKPKKRRK